MDRLTLSRVVQRAAHTVQWLAPRGSLATAEPLLFPPVCAYCHQDLPIGSTSRLCTGCRGRLWYSDPICATCGGPLASNALDTKNCALCRTERFAFDRAITLGPYQDDIQDAVVRMKHAHEGYLARAIGELLSVRLLEQVDTVPDALTWTPMHWRRRVRRGIHSARLLAESAALALCIEGLPLLKSVRTTRKQSLLTPPDRRRNVRDAFAVASRFDLQGTRIGLVDDTLTTGATANELAKQLKRAGAAEVLVLAVARATGGH
ncbi:MAG: ComF family protein [Planctomycetales bacterium]|nr:ComF family protein [Planctomycetales bacterium]